MNENLRSGWLFLLAAIAEISGCWLIWQAVREQRAWWLTIAGVASLSGYGFLAAAQPNSHFGRVLAAYAGVFLVGSLIWAAAFDSFRPSRYDVIGALIGLLGAGVIIFAPGQ